MSTPQSTNVSSSQAPSQSGRFWLVKFAPFRTSWVEIVKRGRFTLRGVRSLLARKHIAGMRVGDHVLFYHSQQERTVVGLLQVTREAYPDPTSADPRWLTCDFEPVRSLARPISIAELRADSSLASLALLRQSRLSVMPLSQAEFETILSHEKENPHG